ncbi:cistern family PEP-CTERM protein [Aerosakkonemataceae cyanobacterium BLCC-F154]|uniref:Cistern family PEP-CTERM protein n=1 Tax=Floridaenema fluviatile BLCC-F154 TaxID=3153640 RepID=A0ABV4YBI9_9CYAN
MLKHFPKLVVTISALAAFQILSLNTAPALGFDFIDDGVGIDTEDIGQEFKVLFEGNVSETDVSGLTSEAIFKFLGFNALGSKTEAAFEITLTNTTSGDLLSRTSALGFDVFNFNGTSLGSKLSLLGIGNDTGNSSGKTRTTGLFSKDRSGSFPNKFGDVDVCFTNGNTCQGGSNGGVDNNPSTSNPQTSKFTATLAMDGEVQRMALNNFGVRYQSINGTSADGQNFNGDSGTGRGTAGPKTTQPPSGGGGPRKIPEPATTLALGVVAISALKLRKHSSLAQA